MKKFKKLIIKFQKSPYIFRNNSLKKCDDLIFFGCNFVMFYPKTTEFVCKNLCDENSDFSIDCCGKPLALSGIKFTNHLDNLTKIFKEKNIKRVVCICPNCYYFFKKNLKEFKIITIYEKLNEMKILKPNEEISEIFMPCPDRIKKEILEDFLDFIPNAKFSCSDVKCCGALDNKKTHADKIKEKKISKLNLYCATCAGVLDKFEVKNTTHILSEFLGVKERVSKNSFKNLLKMKFYKRR